MSRHRPRITLLCVGKTERGFVQAGLEHYVMRVAPFATLELRELRAPRQAPKDPAGAVAREGEAVLKGIGADEHVVLLDEHGQQRNTRELAAWLQRRLDQGAPLTFVVGGAYGVAPEVRARANETLALSLLTLPHQLVRVVFLEQLYRVLSLNAGHGYHHD